MTMDASHSTLPATGASTGVSADGRARAFLLSGGRDLRPGGNPGSVS